MGWSMSVFHVLTCFKPRLWYLLRSLRLQRGLRCMQTASVMPKNKPRCCCWFFSEIWSTAHFLSQLFVLSSAFFLPETQLLLPTTCLLRAGTLSPTAHVHITP